MAIIKTRKHSKQNKTIVKKHSMKKYLKKTMKGGANGKPRTKPKPEEQYKKAIKPSHPKGLFRTKKVTPQALKKYTTELEEYKTAKKTQQNIKKGRVSAVTTTWTIPLEGEKHLKRNRSGITYSIPLSESHIVEEAEKYTHTNTQGNKWEMPLVEVRKSLKNITQNAKERQKLTKEETKAAEAEEKLKKALEKAKKSGRVPLPSVESFPFGPTVKVNPLYENFGEENKYSTLTGTRNIVGVSNDPYAHLQNFRSRSGSVSSKESGYESGSSNSYNPIHKKGEVYYRPGPEIGNDPTYSLPLLEKQETLYATVLPRSKR